MAKEFEKFTISQVGVLIRDNKCLILKFAGGSGNWGFPGGRIDSGELGEEAFRREIREELGFSDFNIIKIIDYDTWHNNVGTPVCGIATLIKNSSDKIKLSNEHVQFKWVTEKEAKNYKFAWSNALRMIKSGFAYKRLLKK
jgi:8-oxo-dGTP diphosphatase